MPGRNLSLLCIDGGGVRGLSALFILKKLMELVNPEMPPKPCEYFDLIGGTSTGGLIAIMLGRLEMDVDSCIKQYKALSSTIFANKRSLPFNMKGNVRARFKHEALEGAIKDIIAEQGYDREAFMKNENGACKVFVCTTSGNTGTPYLFRTYRTPRESSSLYEEVKVWEAARATSAAPSYFEPVVIGTSKRKFGDGATGANNPVVQLWKEAIDLLDADERLDDHLCCLVSLGTGMPNFRKFGDSLKEVAQSILKISLETEETANNFHQSHPELRSRYWRFNTPRGMAEIGLDDAQEVGLIEDLTEHYLKTEETFDRLKACAIAVASSTVREISTSLEQLALHKNSKALVHSVTQMLALIETRSEWRVCKAQHNVEYQVLDELSSYDQKQAFSIRANYRCEKTTGWIVDHPIFRQWLGSASSTTLWIHGKVGAGKSMLMTTAIEAAIKACARRRRAVLHFFYDHSYAKLLDAYAMFEAFIKQILAHLALQDRTAPPHIINMIIISYGPNRRRLDIRELINDLLIPLVQFIGGCTLFCDGLDECDRNHIKECLWALQRLSRLPDCKLVVCSRSDMFMKQSFANATELHIRNDDIQADLCVFIDSYMAELSLDRMLTDNTRIIQKVKTELLARSEGMFLWVKLQIQELWNCRDDAAIEDAVENFPRGLTATYTRCVARLNETERSIARHILPWIAAAAHPMIVEEALDALDLDPHTGRRIGSAPNRAVLQASLANLAEIKDSPDGHILVLAHKSVKDFFWDRSEDAPVASLEFDTLDQFGGLCLTHLYVMTRSAIAVPTSPNAASSGNTVSNIPGHVVTSIGKHYTLLFRLSTSRAGRTAQVSLPSSGLRTNYHDRQDFTAYARRQWLWQTKTVPGLSIVPLSPQRSGDWKRAFRELVLEGTMIGPWIYPWKAPIPVPSAIVHLQTLYAWSITNGHRDLLHLCMTEAEKTTLSHGLDIRRLPLFDSGTESLVPPVHFAMHRGHPLLACDMLEVVKGLAFDLDQDKKSCLHIAAFYDYDLVIRCVQQIVAYADMSRWLCLEDLHGETPLSIAIKNECVKVLAYIITYLNFKTINDLLFSDRGSLYDGHTAYEYVLVRGLDACRRIIEDHLAAKLPIDGRYQYLFSVYQSDPSMLQVLARLKCTDAEHIERYCITDRESVVSVTYKCPPSGKDHGVQQSLLLKAVETFDHNVFEKLIDMGSPMDMEAAFIHDGIQFVGTALHMAVVKNNVKAVRILMANGAVWEARTTAVDVEGSLNTNALTAVQLASMFAKYSTFLYMVEAIGALFPLAFASYTAFRLKYDILSREGRYISFVVDPQFCKISSISTEAHSISPLRSCSPPDGKGHFVWVGPHDGELEIKGLFVWVEVSDHLYDHVSNTPSELISSGSIWCRHLRSRPSLNLVEAHYSHGQDTNARALRVGPPSRAGRIGADFYIEHCMGSWMKEVRRDERSAQIKIT